MLAGSATKQMIEQYPTTVYCLTSSNFCVTGAPAPLFELLGAGSIEYNCYYMGTGERCKLHLVNSKLNASRRRIQVGTLRTDPDYIYFRHHRRNGLRDIRNGICGCRL